MFKVIDVYGDIHEAYKMFIDESGIIQFVLCDKNGYFYTTNNSLTLSLL